MKNKDKAKVKADNPKKLSKSQKKKLQKVLDRRRKKANISDLLNELKKHQLSDEQYAQLTPRFGSKSKGFKQNRESIGGESAAKIYSSGKKKKNTSKNDSIGSTSFKVLDLEVSSSEDDQNEQVSDCEDEKIIKNEDNKPDVSDEIYYDSTKADEQDMKTFKKKKRKNEEIEDKQTITEVRPISVDSKFVPVNRTQEMITARNKLPIIAEEANLIDEIKANPVVIVTGATGSGKTTQVPQFLYEHGFAENKKIVITQPRRVAAISMSKRVAHEMNLGEDVVSFQIRHEGNVTERTRIKFVTDGVLMKELQKDILLTNYSIVIIDEAHERSIYSDILIGLISRIVKLREQRGEFFRLIIMSATLRISDFTKNERLFKQPPPIVNIETRQFPIQIHFSKTTPEDYLKEAYKKVCKIHQDQSPNGGILVFVTGRKEVIYLLDKLKKTFPTNNKQINQPENDVKLKKGKKDKSTEPTTNTVKLKDLMSEISLDNLATRPNNKSLHEEMSDLSDSDLSDTGDEKDEFEIEKSSCTQALYCLPLYSMLPEKEQAKVFEPPPENTRLCVIATNVAETSLTIPNIKFVVDTGKLKNKFYDKTTGIYTHIVGWCAKSSANQRAGRSGRNGPGQCYRLYSSAVYNNDFDEYPEAEILKKPLDDLVLQLKSMFIEKVQNFPFPTVPDLTNIETTEKRLIMLGALEKRIVDAESKTESVIITSLGKIISTFPVSPRYGKMLAIAIQQDLVDYAIAIVSLLTIQEIFILPDRREQDEKEADGANDVIKFKNEDVERFNAIKKKWMNGVSNLGDVMLMLKACFACELNDNKLAYCRAHNLRHKAMIEVHKLRKLLIKEISSNFQSLKLTTELKSIRLPTDEHARKLQQLMLVCFCDHIAKHLTNEELSSSDKLKKIKNAYRSVELEDPVYLHDQAVLKDSRPEWVVYQEIFENNKLYMRTVVAIESTWIPIYAGKQCNFSKPLGQPEPFYDQTADQIKCFVLPTVGPFGWKLKQTSVEYPETNEKYKFFTQFLLEGKIFVFFAKYYNKNLYLSNPKVITKSWGCLKEEPTKLLNTLIENRVCSKRSLRKKFKLKPAFLLEEFKRCVLESHRDTVAQNWPPTD